MEKHLFYWIIRKTMKNLVLKFNDFNYYWRFDKIWATQQTIDVVVIMGMRKK